LVIGVPGDREVDLKRVEAQLSPLEIEPFTDEDFAKHPKLVRGYIGAEILGADSGSGIRYVLDPRVANGTSWVTGANEFGKHRINVVAGRDFTPDQLVDAVEVHAGDPCPECGKDLRIDRGIEIGHVFQLGKKYGLCWPRNIAPANVHVVTTGKNGDDLFVAAEKFATELESRGLTVIFDDRNGVSPGVKFKDAELLGMPVIAVVGKKFESGHIEVRERKSGIQHEVPIEDAINTVVSISKGH
jgi:prolyl-tRNA synthetase